jgi:hypothetical protein
MPFSQKTCRVVLFLHRFGQQHTFAVNPGLLVRCQGLAIDLRLTGNPVGQMQTRGRTPC